jgi:amidase
MSELWRLGVVALADHIRRREVSAREAVDAILARIEAVNPAVNAITVLRVEAAREAAASADAALARGEALGALHGVPFTVKENIDVAGWPTTQGVPALAGNLAPADAPIVGQLRAAGAIPVGSTNLPDFGLRWDTDSSLRGVTRNPWHPSRTPGGSSGGAAAALATGMGPLSLGNDLGGSLRYPAQCCGICAIRPTHGRIARFVANLPAELPATFQLMWVEGPMAREVEDLRVVLGAVSHPDPRDPWWVPAPLRGPVPVPPVRVAVVVDPAGLGVDPEVAAGVRRAADALSAAGYKVEEAEPPAMLEAADMWRRLLLAEIRATQLPLLEQLISADALKALELCFPFIPDLDRVGFMFMLADRNRLLREWLRFFEGHPIVIGPVSTAPPFERGADLESSERSRSIMDSQRFVLPVNLLGLPAVVVPVGVGAGLPQAVQIIGAPYREDLCLDAAAAVERALGRLTPIDPCP